MAHLLNTCWYYCHQYWIDIQDPRTADYPMVITEFNLMILNFILIEMIEFFFEF